MATVATLFINLAAKTGTFLKQVRGSLAQATTAAQRQNAVLARFAEMNERKMAKRKPPPTFTQRGLAALAGYDRKLGEIGIRGYIAARRIGSSFAGVNRGLGLTSKLLGGVGVALSALSVATSVGQFFTRTFDLAVGRFKETRQAVFEITKLWRKFELASARAFAPLITTAARVINSDLAKWLGKNGELLEAVASVAAVAGAAIYSSFQFARVPVNLLTIALRTVLATIGAIAATVENVTDLLGITDRTSNVSGEFAMNNLRGIGTDVGDIGDAFMGQGRAYDIAASGGQSPRDAGLTEQGLGGSEALFQQSREQTTLLRKIADGISSGNRGPY